MGVVLRTDSVNASAGVKLLFQMVDPGARIAKLVGNLYRSSSQEAKRSSRGDEVDVKGVVDEPLGLPLDRTEGPSP